MISNEHNCACKPSAEATFFLPFIQFPHSSCLNYFVLAFFALSLSLFLVSKFPVLRVLLPHCYSWCYDLPDAVTLLLLSLLFHSSKCIREFYESETLSWDRTVPYRATSFCVRTCVIRFIFQLCVHTHANHVQTLATATATAISYWWSKLVSFVRFFFSFPFSN